MIDYKAKIAINLPALIAAAGEVAFEYAEDDNDGRRLASLALIEFLRDKANAASVDDGFFAPATGRESLQ